MYRLPELPRYCEVSKSPCKLSPCSSTVKSSWHITRIICDFISPAATLVLSCVVPVNWASLPIELHIVSFINQCLLFSAVFAQELYRVLISGLRLVAGISKHTRRQMSFVKSFQKMQIAVSRRIESELHRDRYYKVQFNGDSWLPVIENVIEEYHREQIGIPHWRRCLTISLPSLILSRIIYWSMRKAKGWGRRVR